MLLGHNEADKPPHVVVAIVATDEVKNIIGCLRSLKDSLYRSFSVVICENGGPDAFVRDVDQIAALKEIAPVPEGESRSDQARARFHFGADKRLLTILNPGENNGYSGGVNACVSSAGLDWRFIWVLNPDTFPEPEALGALVRRQAQRGYGIVGSRIVYASTGRIQLWGGFRYWRMLGRCRSHGANKPFDAIPDVEAVEAQLDVISGASMFVSREYIEAIGVMDKDFFVYYEDVEWSLRRRNFRLGYAHDSVVHHIAGATSGSGGLRPKRSRFNLYLSERNRVLVAKKRFRAIWPLLAFFALLQTVEFLIRFHSGRAFGIAVAGWWAGITGETGMPRFMRGSSGQASKGFLSRVG